ncbi:MAG: acetyl-CoA carboxylase [Lachnospiraceae bacterium]|nr:acetyl-CoA carboxylase [Ruminococcus sp.]MCM1274199.1 acetyl-CoA carboxylase [Lachnospiraceae bacterium]
MAVRKSLAEMERSVPDSDARKRLAAFLDEDSFTELDKFLSADGGLSSVVAGSGTVGGEEVLVFAQDVSVKGGAVNTAAALKIKRVYELAARNGIPVVGFFDSKGADINEGMAVLSAYGDIMKASAAVSGVVPQIAVVTGVCAGCAAMLAAMADVVIATEKSELFLTAPFNNADGKLAGAGTAENAAKAGICQILAKDGAEAVAKAKSLVSMLPLNNLDIGFVEDASENDAAISSAMKGAELAAAVAQKGSVIELGEKFGTAAYTALGALNGTTAAFVATDGAAKLTAADCAKIARFVQFADLFSIPVVTFVNTEGFEGSSAAELGGSVRDCAKLAQVYATATTLKVNVVTGKAFGAAYAAFDSADVSFAWESAEIAPMSPEAGKAFMGEELTTDPFAAAALGMVDGVIAAEDTREALSKTLGSFGTKRMNPVRKRANYTF